MRRPLALLLTIGTAAGCAHSPAPAGCRVESGWLDATNGCSERAGYPDCYRVCPDGSRVRVQDLGKASKPQSGATPPEAGAAQPQSAAPR